MHQYVFVFVDKRAGVLTTVIYNSVTNVCIQTFKSRCKTCVGVLVNFDALLTNSVIRLKSSVCQSISIC